MALTYDFDNGPSITIDGSESIAIIHDTRQEMRSVLLDYLQGVRADVRHDAGQRDLMDRLIETIELWHLKPNMFREQYLPPPPARRLRW